jgi:hypothetical protein
LINGIKCPFQIEENRIPYIGPLALLTVSTPKSAMFRKNDYYGNQIAVESTCFCLRSAGLSSLGAQGQFKNLNQKDHKESRGSGPMAPQAIFFL